MAWTTPRTWVTGEVVSAAQLNEQIRDNENFIRQLHGAKGTRSAVKSIVTATWTLIDFDTETYDSDAIHDLVTNNSRLVVPTGFTGKWQVIVSAHWASNATAAYRRAKVKKNAAGAQGGGTSVGPDPHTLVANGTNNVELDNSYTATDAFVVTDYTEMFVQQNSGGNLDVTPTLDFNYVGGN
jgi:hypothetical protein